MRALRSHLPALLAVALLAVSGCDNGEATTTGLDANMRVIGAREYPEELVAPDGGPELVTLTTSNSTVRAGIQSKTFTGVAAKGAEVIALSFSGDKGRHWRVPTTNVSTENMQQVTFSAQASFSPKLKAGTYQVIARALDSEGRAGAPQSLDVTVVESIVPDGALVVSLTWDTQSDLDLHVVTPDNTELWSGKINTYTPPTVGIIDPEQVAAGGVLLFDSNSQCVLDGQREEDAVWTRTPPSGHYVVRVDTFSLCGQPGANWRIEAHLNGTLIGSASGSSVDADTRLPHEKGAGLFALQFDVP
jgi:hypothetical protein